MKKIKDKYSDLEPRSKRYYWRHRKEMWKKMLVWQKSNQFEFLDKLKRKVKG